MIHSEGVVEVQNMNPTCWDPIDFSELITPSNLKFVVVCTQALLRT